jgi:hypothetical protein
MDNAEELRAALRHASRSPQLAGEPALLALLEELTEAAIAGRDPQLPEQAGRQAARLRARLYEYREAHPLERHHIYLPRGTWRVMLRRPGYGNAVALPDAKPWVRAALAVLVAAALVGAWLGWRIWEVRQSAGLAFGSELNIHSYCVEQDGEHSADGTNIGNAKPISDPELPAYYPVTFAGGIAYWQMNREGRWQLATVRPGEAVKLHEVFTEAASPLSARANSVLASLDGAIHEVYFNGVAPVALTQPPAGMRDSHPHAIEDSQAFLFARSAAGKGTSIYYEVLSTEPQVELVEGITDFQGFASTPLFKGFYFAGTWKQQKGLFIYRFQDRAAEPAAIGGSSSRQPQFAAKAEKGVMPRLYWLNVEEKRQMWRRSSAVDSWEEVPLPKPAGGVPVFSPDGTNWAMRILDGTKGGLYLHPKGFTLALGDLSVTGSPVWSPDGKQLIFPARRTGRAALYSQALEGGSPRLLATCPGEAASPGFSSDGAWLGFLCGMNLYRLPWPLPGGINAAPVLPGVHALEFHSAWGGLVARDFAGVRFRVDLAKGRVERIAVKTFVEPYVLASAKGQFLWFDGIGNLRLGDAELANSRLLGPSAVPVTDADRSLSWSPDGKWIYLHSRAEVSRGIEAMRPPTN